MIPFLFQMLFQKTVCYQEYCLFKGCDSNFQVNMFCLSNCWSLLL